ADRSRAQGHAVAHADGFPGWLAGDGESVTRDDWTDRIRARQLDIRRIVDLEPGAALNVHVIQSDVGDETTSRGQAPNRTITRSIGDREICDGDVFPNGNGGQRERVGRVRVPRVHFCGRGLTATRGCTGTTELIVIAVK